jgi:hypothetical protein
MTITIKDLIDQLRDLPPDTPVKVCDWETGLESEVSGVDHMRNAGRLQYAVIDINRP